ncbi:ADP-ribose pyrophosphatase [Klebsiella pneumoniae]|uniref:ADP-ribose pyrophosphatase n=1 Tax=Klebsiella pneumoniae TaxID=573 RepID=A0A378B7R3_KLEPN|nr:ADP-ribose pyrophosphatase [Klebsiella pneumoniae]
MKKKLTAADMHDPQVIAETPWFSMRKVGIDVAPGERRDFYSIHYPRPAVGIVAIQDEKVLLIRHYRYLIDKVVWAIPSGGVDGRGKTRRSPHWRECGKRPAGRRNALRRSFALTLLRQQRSAVYHLAGHRFTLGGDGCRAG